jgi:hypothetical protein
MCWNANSSKRVSVKRSNCAPLSNGSSVFSCEVARLYSFVKLYMCPPAERCVYVLLSGASVPPCEIVRLCSPVEWSFCASLWNSSSLFCRMERLCLPLKWHVCVHLWSGSSVFPCEMTRLYPTVKWRVRVHLWSEVSVSLYKVVQLGCYLSLVSVQWVRYAVA